VTKTTSTSDLNVPPAAHLDEAEANSKLACGLNDAPAHHLDEQASVDRRSASKARLRRGIRCHRTYHEDVALAAMLTALGYDVGDGHAGAERALQQMLDDLEEDYRRAVAGDMSPRGVFRCAILDDDLNR
jgi:hypothetical protein